MSSRRMVGNVRISILLLVLSLYHGRRTGAPFCVHAFSSAAPNNNNHISPWKTASWKLILDIGRPQENGDESSSTTPYSKEWGQSGARLSFPVQIQVDSDRLPEQEQDVLMAGGACRLRVVHPETITYITSEQGEQIVPFVSGGWKLRLASKKGHASLLRFWLDVGENASKNNKIVAQKKDVTLQAKERLYFAAHCWRQSDLILGRKKVQPLADAYERAQRKLEQQVSHDEGDRRLDGTDVVETLAAYGDMAALTLERDEKRRQFYQAMETLPPPASVEMPLGNWPGSNELLAVKPMELFVKSKSGGLFSSEEYHLIGTWTARPMDVIVASEDATVEVEDEDEEEYDYYADDEEYEDEEDDEFEYDEDDDEEDGADAIEKEDQDDSHDSTGNTNELDGGQEETNEKGNAFSGKENFKAQS